VAKAEAELKTPIKEVTPIKAEKKPKKLKGKKKR
jgi:hypothetical protein